MPFPEFLPSNVKGLTWILLSWTPTILHFDFKSLKKIFPECKMCACVEFLRLLVGGRQWLPDGSVVAGFLTKSISVNYFFNCFFPLSCFEYPPGRMSTLLADPFTFAIYSWSYETWFGIQTLDGFPFMFNRAITHTWAIGPHGWVGSGGPQSYSPTDLKVYVVWAGEPD